MHTCKPTLAQSVPVKETFKGSAVWEGVVHVFDIKGHLTANRAYAWSSPIEGSDKPGSLPCCTRGRLRGPWRRCGWRSWRRSKMKATVTTAHLLYGYGLSVLVGIPVTWIWAETIHWLVARRFKDEPNHPTRIWSIPMLLGVTERAMVTTLVIWLPSAAGAFMGAWIAVKAAGGWGRLQGDSLRNRVLYLTGLLGSGASMLWAVAWAIWASN